MPTRSSIHKRRIVTKKESPPPLHDGSDEDDTEAFQWYLDHGIQVPEAKVGYKVDVSRLRARAGTSLLGGWISPNTTTSAEPGTGAPDELDGRAS